MSTQQTGGADVYAPNIFDGIYLVYGANDLSRPVGIVHSTWGAGIVGVENVVAEEQWLLFRGQNPSNDYTSFQVPGGGAVVIRNAAAYPNRLPFHWSAPAALSATVFVQVEGSRQQSSDAVFNAWSASSSSWLKDQRYAHFKVSNLSWPPPDASPPLGTEGRIEQMDPMDPNGSFDRRISFGEMVVTGGLQPTQRIVTAFETVNQGDRAIAVDIAVNGSTFNHFRSVVEQSFSLEKLRAVLSEGQVFDSLPERKPYV